MIRRRLAGIAIVFVALANARAAYANPRTLPFTYPSESLPKGGFELEQYFDLTPVKFNDSTGTKGGVWSTKYVITTEYEYGITDRLELGLYLEFANDTGTGGSSAPPALFDGIKQRLRYRLAAPGRWPVDVAFYLETAEFYNEFELEGKVILQRRVGPVAFMVNLWAEREFYYNGIGEWVLNPTAGVTWQLHPMFHLGLEYWMHAELGGPATTDPVTRANQDAHHYLGPAAMLQFRRFWWTTGVYARLDDIAENTRSLPGELYGHFWVRTMLGLDF